MQYKFKKDFIWGAATSSYQIEGAHNVDGKSESIWDRFCKKDGAIEDGTSGEIACDHYNRIEEDVALMVELNLEAYRFSISWPRIIPNGFGEVEQRGLDFYNKLINTLIKNGIEPVVTLYHWDLPQVLEDKGGWSNREIVSWFEEYTKVVVNAFGDRVTKWCTINEPMVICNLGYNLGIHAPGVKDTERYYQAVHNVNLSHARSYKILKEYNSDFIVGSAQALFANYATDPSDAELMTEVNKQNDEMMWIYLSPITKGVYPDTNMENILKYNGDIVLEDLKEIKGTSDYIGVNLYSRIVIGFDEDGNPSRTLPEGAAVTDIGWEVYPNAIYDMMHTLKDDYDNLPVFITENGASYDYPVVDGRVKDIKRTDYFKKYIGALNKSIDEGCNVQGYFAWSLMDNFEWAYGYSQRFGIIDVNYETQKRTIKDSGHFYATIIKNSGFDI